MDWNFRRAQQNCDEDEAVPQALNLQASKGAVFCREVCTKTAAPLFLQKDIEKGVVNPYLAVIFDEAEFSEAIHEKTHSGPVCANHLSQHLRADLRPNFQFEVR
jgi:hypothetical protein